VSKEIKNKNEKKFEDLRRNPEKCTEAEG